MYLPIGRGISKTDTTFPSIFDASKIHAISTQRPDFCITPINHFLPCCGVESIQYSTVDSFRPLFFQGGRKRSTTSLDYAPVSLQAAYGGTTVGAKVQQRQMAAIFMCDGDIFIETTCQRSVACSEYFTSVRNKINTTSIVCSAFLGVREETMPSAAEGQSKRFHLDQWNLLFNFVTCGVSTCMGSLGREHAWCTYPTWPGVPGPSIPPKRGFCWLTLNAPPPSRKANPARRNAFQQSTEPMRTAASPAHLKAPNHSLQTHTTRGNE